MPLTPERRYFTTIMTIILAMVTAMSPFAIDTYLAAMPTMADYFNVELNKIELTLSLYYLGFALGNFIGGPLSDSFGRKRVALTGMVLYGLAAVSIPYLPNVEMVWGFRLIQAFGGGFASVTAMVFVRDLFEGKMVAKLATIISMIMMLAPLFAPVVGTAFLKLGSWKTIFFFLSLYAVLIFLVYLIIMPESRKKEYITKTINREQIFGKYKVFFANKVAVFILLSTSFSMSGMFVFITGASFIYLEYFGFEEGQFPILFGANVVLNVVLSLLNTQLLRKFSPEGIMKTGVGLQVLAAAILLGVVMVKPNFWGVFLPIVLYVGSLGMIFGNATAIILNRMPHISGSANATIGVTRFVFSFIMSALPALFYNGTLIPIGAIVFFCALMALVFYMLFNRQLELKQGS